MCKEAKEGITLRDLALWGNAETCMSPEHLRKRIGRIWMDSRKISNGDVFIALAGDSDDGHHYVNDAFQKGAVASIISRKQIHRYPEKYRSRLLLVDNPLGSLHKMAEKYRKILNIPVVAVTGSNGKTTTRQFIAAVLGRRFNVGESGGNWNNHIGVPLSVLNFSGSENFGVLELAANHHGEIRKLSRIVSPDIGVITNIGYAHIGNFGSLSSTAKAKFEILDGMNRNTGFILLNGDDRYLVKGAVKRGIPVVFFGLSARCGLRVSEISSSTKGEVRFVIDGQKYSLSMPGRHFVYNALPAIFLGRWFGISYSEIADAIYSIKAGSLRGTIMKKRGITFIVDCYNANPSSMRSAIDLLRDVSAGKRMFAIVGDMLEMGSYTVREHRALGKLLFKSGVKKVLAVGNYAEYVASAAVKEGMMQSNIKCAANVEEAVVIAKKMLKKGDTVILKGSRTVGLENLYNSL